MAAVLKQAEVGVPVAEVCRRVGITEQTYYRWKKRYVGLEIDQVRQLKQLRSNSSIPKQTRAETRSSAADSRGTSGLWVSQDPGAAEARGLAHKASHSGALDSLG